MTKRTDEGFVETARLLSQAEQMGLTTSQVGEIIGVSAQRISDYRKAVREGKGYPMPRNHRATLDVALKKLYRVNSEARGAYPSQRTARAHDAVEYMARLTDASGPLWQMYEELCRSIIRMAEEAHGETPVPGPDPSAKPDDDPNPAESGDAQPS